MRRQLEFLIAALIVLGGAVSCALTRSTATTITTTTSVAAQAQAVAVEPQKPLSPDQQRVVDYLTSHWGREMNVTGVSLVMRIVGGDYTDDDRVAIGRYLKDHPELHRTLRTFGWETVALDPLEKRIALVLSRAEREEKAAPSLNELSEVLQATPAAITRALQMLERFGIVSRDPSVGGIDHLMAEERYVDWEGAMRITFMDHRVGVEGLDPFNVN